MKPTLIKAAAAGTVILVIAGICVFCIISSGTFRPGPVPVQAAGRFEAPLTKPKVLYVDSYHKGYVWSSGIQEGILGVFHASVDEDDAVDCSRSPVDLRIVRMNTKRNQSERFLTEAGRKVKTVIKQWHPDVVITSDDNAAWYVIVPYFYNADLPFVFCGVNWDASGYHFPCRNVTGMIQVDLVCSMLKAMHSYADGERLGVLGADTVTNRKSVEQYVEKLCLRFDETVFVPDPEALKAAYLDMQKRVDMLILLPPSFISTEAEKADLKAFVLEHNQIITGSTESWIAPYTLFCCAMVAGEQGEWAAKTALRILDGERPEDIPIVQNRRAALYLNMPLARKKGIVFPVDMLERAVLIGD